jgi:hypothetical protein
MPGQKIRAAVTAITVMFSLTLFSTPASSEDLCDPLSPDWVYTEACDVEIISMHWSSFVVDVGTEDARIDYSFIVRAPSGLSEFRYVCGEMGVYNDLSTPGTAFGVHLPDGKFASRTSFVRVGGVTTTFPINASGDDKSFTLSGHIIIPKGTNPFDGGCAVFYPGALTSSGTPSGGDFGEGGFSLIRTTDRTPPELQWRLSHQSVDITDQDAKVSYSLTASDSASVLGAEILCQESGYVQKNGLSEYDETTASFVYSRGYTSFASNDIVLSMRVVSDRWTPPGPGNLQPIATFSDRGKEVSQVATISGNDKRFTLRGEITIAKGTPSATLICIGLAGDRSQNITLDGRSELVLVNRASAPISSVAPSASATVQAPTSSRVRASQEAKRAEQSTRGESAPESQGISGRPNTSDVKSPLTNNIGELPQVGPGKSTMLVNGVENSLDTQRMGNSLFRTATSDGLSVDIIQQSGSSPTSNAKSAPTFTRGQATRLSGKGFAPNSLVVVWLFSTPTKLGETQADSNGNFDFEVMINDELQGDNHTLQVSGEHADGTTRALMIGVNVDGSSNQNLILTLALGGLFGSGMIVAAVAVKKRLKDKGTKAKSTPSTETPHLRT